ncbi:MAG: pyrroline-5-carboxylate reductase [Paenibacillaceae bacterium]
MHSLTEKNICFIGAGSMSEAIVRGLTKQNRLNPNQITMTNRGNQERLSQLNKAYGVSGAVDEHQRKQAISTADIIVLAMKPKDAADAIRMYHTSLQTNQLLISVIAGLSIASIEKLAGLSLPIVRSMPNTSSTIGLGATGISYSNGVSTEQKRLARDIFESTGIVCEVEEAALDIVTGVSGSGPAYIYYVMEAMIAGGVSGGLNESTARLLTVQTVLGAANMVLQTEENPADLRKKVTSPGGTTQAALELMSANGVSEHITNAVLRAAERAGELGKAIAEQIDANMND